MTHYFFTKVAYTSRSTGERWDVILEEFEGDVHMSTRTMTTKEFERFRENHADERFDEKPSLKSSS